MESAALPEWEMILYWFLSFTCHLYSFYQLHLFSKEHEESLDREVQLEKGFLIWGSKRMPLILSGVSGMSGHGVLCSGLRLVMLWCPSSPVCVGLSVRCPLCLVAPWLEGRDHSNASPERFIGCCSVAEPRPFLGLLFVAALTLHISSVQDIQRGWYDSDEQYSLLMFSIAMCVLRCVSFSLELCWSPLQDGGTNRCFSFLNFRKFLTQLYNLVSYCFYHPLFYNGPIINYNHFNQQMERAVCKVSPALLLGRTLRVCVWWCVAELMIHLMYMHSIQNNETYLTMLPSWALGGLALALVQFFYVKYLVLFGVASLLMNLDGIEPPPLPRCVSTMYSFRGMWRHFDVGLYRWLIRYVYFPLGGSQHGLLQKLISMAMTFSFVCLWHGCHDYLQCWALLNWVCVFTENSITLFLCWPPLHHTIVSYVSPPMRRRGLALISAFSTAMLILSNLVFLGGIHIGCVYWERVYMQGWSSMAVPVIGCLYCFAQVGLEMDRKT